MIESLLERISLLERREFKVPPSEKVEGLHSCKAIMFTRNEKKSRVDYLKRKMYAVFRKFLKRSFLENSFFSHKFVEIVLREVVIEYG